MSSEAPVDPAEDPPSPPCGGGAQHLAHLVELPGQSAEAVDGFVAVDGLTSLLDQHLGAGAVVLGHRRAAPSSRALRTW